MFWQTDETEEQFDADRSQHGDFEAIRRLIDRTLTNRTIPDFPAYFIGSKWLVTYEWHADAVLRLETTIDQLRWRVFELEAKQKPWWRRWLSR